MEKVYPAMLCTSFLEWADISKTGVWLDTFVAGEAGQGSVAANRDGAPTACQKCCDSRRFLALSLCDCARRRLSSASSFSFCRRLCALLGIDVAEMVRERYATAARAGLGLCVDSLRL